MTNIINQIANTTPVILGVLIGVITGAFLCWACSETGDDLAALGIIFIALPGSALLMGVIALILSITPILNLIIFLGFAGYIIWFCIDNYCEWYVYLFAIIPLLFAILYGIAIFTMGPGFMHEALLWN